MTKHRKLQPAEETITEPLSPELVLVDPQLANLARERLRVVGDSAALGSRAVAPASQPGPAEGSGDAGTVSDDFVERSVRERLATADVAFRRQEGLVHAPPAVARREFDPGAISPDDMESDSSFASPRRRRRRAVAAVSAVLAIAAAGLVIFVRELNGSGGGADGATATSLETNSVRGTGHARQNGRANELSRARSRTVPPRSPLPSLESKKRPKPARPSEFPTRIFVWLAVPRATFYKVEFFRRGRKIFEASPTKPRIELPLLWVFKGRHFRLTPATYRWEVRAAFGTRSRPRFGKPITRSTWNAQ
jgi:hypothetical protein